VLIVRHHNKITQKAFLYIQISSFGGNVFNFFIHYFFESCYNIPSALVVTNLDYENVNLLDFVCGFKIQKLSRSALLSCFPLKIKGRFMRLEDSIVIKI
jgi:hypothetical protein